MVRVTPRTKHLRGRSLSFNTSFPSTFQTQSRVGSGSSRSRGGRRSGRPEREGVKSGSRDTLSQVLRGRPVRSLGALAAPLARVVGRPARGGPRVGHRRLTRVGRPERV